MAPPSSARWPRLAAAAHWTLLLLAYLFVVALKIQHTHNVGRHKPGDDTLLFKAESAMQYRYAKTVAAGEPLAAVDTTVQFPEGLRVFDELTIGMEYYAGLSYRLLGALGFHPPFHLFLTYLMILHSSLMVFLLYGLSRVVWEERGWALAATWLFAALPAGMGRVVGAFALEDFAFPLIFGYVGCFLRAGAGPSRTSDAFAVAAGLLCAASLATWHFSKFFMIVFVVALAVACLWNDESRQAFRPLLIKVAIVLAAGLTVPVLRHQGFILSAPMALAYALLGTMWLRGFGRLSARLAPVAFVVLAVAILLLSAPIQRQSSGESAHVLSLLFYKLKFLLVKPADPAALNMEARMLWIEDFNSPTAAFALFNATSLLILGPLSILAGARLLRASTLTSRQIVAFLMAGAFSVAGLMVKRLFVFQVPLLCLLIGALHRAFPRRRLLVGLSLLIAIEAFGTAAYYRSGGGWKAPLARGQGQVSADPSSNEFHLTVQDEYEALLEWIKRRTPEESVFLSVIGTSAEIWSYADRSINLHPKFESKRLRDKAAAFLAALYAGSEEPLYRLCRRWKTDYVVYKPELALARSMDSYRYQADVLALSTSAAAFRLHFFPERLEGFSLVYENSGFRVFKVGGRARESSVLVGKAEPVYDLSSYQDPINPDGTFNDASARPVAQALRETTLAAADGYASLASGDQAAAVRALERAASSGWASSITLTSLGRAYLSGGGNPAPEDLRRAAGSLAQASELNPQYPPALRLLGSVRFALGDVRAAEAALRKAVELDPDDAISANNLGIVLHLTGRRGEAASLFERASASASADARIFQNLAIAKGERPGAPLDFIFLR